MHSQRRRDAERYAAEDDAAGHDRPHEQREQRQHQRVDLAEPHGVLERLPREKDRRERQRRRGAQRGRAHDPREGGHEQGDAHGEPRGDRGTPGERAERQEWQHGKRRVRESVDVHEPLVGVQRAQPLCLGNQRGVAIHTLDTIHSGVVERDPGTMQVRGRIEDREIARVAVARGVQRAHCEAAAEERHDEGQRDDGDGDPRDHRRTSRACA